MSDKAESQQAPVIGTAGQDSVPGLFRNPVWLLLLLAAYFTLQVGLRTAMSSSVDLDESEQVVLAQQFSWGYGPDPPLYTWLQIPCFRVLGESVLALSILKNLLLFSVYGLTFRTARVLTRSVPAAAAATLSLLYLPSLAWESQRDLTHTILAAALALATLLCLLQVCETRQTRWYVLFGISAGFGLMSKYNYALWLVGLVLGGFSVRELRPALRDKRALLSLAIMLGIFLPNGLWMLRHRDQALLTSSKLEIAPSSAWFVSVATGLKNILQSLAAFAGPITPIYATLFLKAPRQVFASPGPDRLYQRLIIRAWIIIGAILVLVVLFARMTGFKERWFQPLLICLPILAVSLIQWRLDGSRLKCIAALSVLVMLAVALVMPGRLLLAERLQREEPLTRPYAELASQIRRVVPKGALVVCDTRLLAGNLRLGLPQTRVLPSDLVPFRPGHPPHCVVIWDARKNELPPDDLQKWAEISSSGRVKQSRPQYFAATYYHHRAKQYRLGLIQF